MRLLSGPATAPAYRLRSGCRHADAGAWHVDSLRSKLIAGGRPNAAWSSPPRPDSTPWRALLLLRLRRRCALPGHRQPTAASRGAVLPPEPYEPADQRGYLAVVPARPVVAVENSPRSPNGPRRMSLAPITGPGYDPLQLASGTGAGPEPGRAVAPSAGTNPQQERRTPQERGRNQWPRRPTSTWTKRA